MMKRILVHSLIFSPDGVSTAYLYNDIVLSLQASGYDVVVLTTTPHFNIVQTELDKQPMRWRLWGVCKESRFNGVRVLHVPQKKFKSTILRIIAFAYWHFVSFFIALAIKHVDLIISPSPPLTIGLLNLVLAKLKGCKVVYNVQEVYPDILKLKDGLILRVLGWIERKVYNGSDAVTTIDKVFYDTIVSRFKNSNKLHIIPNFVDNTLYKKVDWEEWLDKDVFSKSNSIKLLYAGNIGIAQSWEPLLEMANRTRDLDVEYFVIGEGAKRGYVEREIARLGLAKFHLLTYQPRELMPAILSYADLSFIFMAPEIDRDGFPSKVYTILACECPLLVMSGEDTPIVNFLKDKGCAKLLTAVDFEQKVEEAVGWLRCVSKEALRAMGQLGLQVVQDSYTKDKVLNMYVELVETLI